MTAVTLEGPPSLCLPSFLRCRANAEVSIGTPLENPLWATLPSSPTGVHPTIRFAASALQRFVYMTGQRRRAFRNARLAGSWNSWADIPMAEIVAEDGCLAFAATVSFDDGQAGQRVWWGVRLDGPAGANAWGIMTDDQQRQQELQLPGPGASAEAHYYLTWSRRLGAQKHYPGGSAAPDLRLGAERPERGGFVRDRRRLYRRRRRWEGPQSAGCVAAADDRRHLGKRSGSGLRRKRGRAIYVPDQERPGPNHLPHRHLLRWQIGRVRWTQGRTWRASGPALVPECSASTKTSSGCAASTGPSAPARSISCTPPTPTASSPSPAGMGRPRCSLWRA